MSYEVTKCHISKINYNDMENNNLRKQSILNDEQYNEYQSQTKCGKGSRAVAVFENGSPWKMYDSIEDCARDFPNVAVNLIPCMYMGHRFVWFDTLPPVVKLVFTALDDIKNKAILRNA